MTVKTNTKEQRPLFIPLKGVHFDAFASGRKRNEYRLYGPRWNYTTCYIGRRIVLSRGYGKKLRLFSEITAVASCRLDLLRWRGLATPAEQDELENLAGGDGTKIIIAIGLGDIRAAFYQ